MELKKRINVTRQCQSEELSLFISEVNRLSLEKAHFSLNFVKDQENKLYLFSCKGIQEHAYAIVDDQESASVEAAIINYAIVLNAFIKVQFEEDLIFTIYIDAFAKERLEAFSKMFKH